jgi:hypothetical protein
MRELPHRLRKLRSEDAGEKMSSWVIGSGVICAAALCLGLAILTPGSVFRDICELVGIAAGVVFVGLMDGVAEQVCAMVGKPGG